MNDGSDPHILDKQTDEIVGTLNSDKAVYVEAKRKDTLDNQNIFDFTANAKIDKASLLEKRNRLVIQDEDGFFREYIIVYAERHNHSEKIVQSNASIIDLAKAKTIEPQTLQGATSASATDFALLGTEWQVGVIDYTFIRTIQIKEYTNPLAVLRRIASTFDLEIRYRVEIKGNKITGRFWTYLGLTPNR
ncbi:phage tail spike protein [Neobacillus ginsengisoli]|uniref:Phage minor structural protein n=1 Tax=Neobacillus ginsengisoli TaxID=904295 RepID=A0ABT9Y399_9BACI|nr:phage tail spike protein [Neobacillus ginsengisoli]MDQ0201672.1 phage minor structural protein [Neobacillus ginsengisoli]